MQTLFKGVRRLGRKGPLFACGWAALSFFSVTSSFAQAPAARISNEIDNSERAAIVGSHPPVARAENDAGRVPAGTQLQGMSIIFSRTAAQEAHLQALIAAQQDPSLPLYHKWLTPDEFAARFGVADADIAKVQAWLEQQGFTVHGVSRSKNRIIFSGTVGQAEAAFASELHYYNVNGEKHYAPSTDISVPVALFSVVQGVRNLSTFKPRPRVKYRTRVRAPKANFTSSQSGNHFLTPGDIATIYNITPAFKAGITGTGQSIAVMGQSAIVVTDIENFQSAAGLPKKEPTQILVPNSGTSTVVSGDESESDLDLEYAGAIAPGATIYFIYVGNGPNKSVWDSLTYAVDNATAPIISTSYGDCELRLTSDYASLNSVLAQAASQGQTVIAPAGDGGSTDCFGDTALTAAQQEALTVDFPASSQYVTGIGGSEFLAADVAVGNTQYWAATNGSDVISSALSYIPEQVWNDDSATNTQNPISAGGGGASTLTPRPSWQTGVPGIPSGNFRLVPDVSLAASPNHAGFLYCSSDSQNTGVTGSCANGFRDSGNVNLTVAGGTSFGVPIFAGMVALINQDLKSTGQGVINPTLYALAANPTTYAAAFHDIAGGGNQCTAGTTNCSTAGAAQYAATVGYDEASGLGSIDFSKLLSAWPSSTSVSGTKGFTVSATNVTVTTGSAGTSTVTITPQNGYTGTIAWTVTSSPSITNGCITLPNTTVSGISAVTATLAINTSSTACASGATRGAGGKHQAASKTPIAYRENCRAPATLSAALASLAMAGLLLIGLLQFRSRRAGALAAALLLVVMGFATSGCSSGSSSSSSSSSPSTINTAKGAYTVTIVGTDTSSSSITASTTMTLTIQ